MIGKPGELKGTKQPPCPVKVKNGWKGEITYIDRFGNLSTNLPNTLNGTVCIGKQKEINRVEFYSHHPEYRIFFLSGSDGFIEVAVNQGSAVEYLNVERGEPVFILSKIES